MASPDTSAPPATPAPYCLVTGASRGIGAGISRRLAADGFDIVLNFRASHEAAAKVAGEVRACGRQAWLLPFDVSDRSAARDALEGMLVRQGTPYGVVVNAGITRDGLFGMLGDADWDEVIATGLGGFYNVVRPLIRALMQA